MLLIDEKTLVVHMKKCGGTAFCKGLIDTLPPERLFFLGYTAEGEDRSAQNSRKGLIWKHSPAKDIIRQLDPDRKKISKILLISDRPFWERVASFYLHVKRHNARNPEKYKWAVGLSFKDYLRSDYAEFEKINDYALDASGNMLVDEIVPHDKISEVYETVSAACGLPGQKMPRLNVNPIEVDYRLFYGQDDWDLVVGKYQDEVELLKGLGKTVDVQWTETVQSKSRQKDLVFPDTPAVRKNFQDIGLIASKLRVHSDSTFEMPMKFNMDVKFSKPVHIGAFSMIYSANVDACNIGRYCVIENGVTVGDFSGLETGVSTSRIQDRPVFRDWARFSNSGGGADAPMKPNRGGAKRTVIGNDVRIQRGARIQAGVRIGDGAIVLPGSYVDRDVAPYAIVAGSPAQVVRFRFDDVPNDPVRFRKGLTDLAWWQYSLHDTKGIDFAQTMPLADLTKALQGIKPYKGPLFRGWELASVAVGVVPPYLALPREETSS